MEDDHQDATTNNGAAPNSAHTPPPASRSEIEDAVIVDEQITSREPRGVIAPASKGGSSLHATTPPPVQMKPPASKGDTSFHATILPPSQMKPPAPQPAEIPTSETIPHPLAPATTTLEMTDLLKSVKLPERYTQKGAADKSITPPIAPMAPEPISSAPKKVVTEILTPQSAQQRTPSPVTSVHTLKNDLQDISREQKVSLVHAVSLEEDRRAREKPEPQTPATQQRSKRTFTMIFLIVLLVTIGVGAFLLALNFANTSRGTSPLSETPSILFAEQSVALPLTGHTPANLKQTLVAGRGAYTQSLGSIVRIVPTVTTKDANGADQEVPATFSNFMKSLGANVPDDLLRALGDDFFLGLHTVDENAPVLIIPVTSFDRAFAGMLTWEPTMNADLAPLFTALAPLYVDKDGIPQTRVFQDLVMRNHDVRALKDDKGEIQLYYSFPNQNILVIAESPYSFIEILSRLQAGRNL